MDVVKNFAKVVVSTGYAAGATSITLSTGHGAKLPDPAADGAFNLVWWNVTDYPDPTDDSTVEIVRCTARTGDVLTVTRAQESTADVDHNAATKTYQMILSLTKKMIDDIATALTAAANIVNDTTPQLGGNLDMQTHKLVGEGGSDGVYVDSVGNVGIGTAAPEARLTLGDETGEPKFRIWGEATSLGSARYVSISINTWGLLYMSGTFYQLYLDSGIKITDQNLFTFGNGNDYSIGYDSSSDTLRLVDGNTIGSNIRMAIDSTGNVGIGAPSPTAKLDVNSDILRLRTAKTPASAGAAGNQGDWCWDADYVYVCVDTNTWKRSALTTW